jgi:[protein-PII] uridylyltransferase
MAHAGQIDMRAPSAALRDRAAQVDSVVADFFERTKPDLTVVAVGGYGRRELFPYSDVDLLLLVDRIPETAHQKDPIADFLRQLWDSGLRVSQSVRTVSDCCELHEGNLELTISLLDRRHLCGPAERFADLESRFPKFLGSQKSAIVREL